VTEARLSAAALASALEVYATPAKAAAQQRFFKTGEGEYGEGDVFIGVRVPEIRAVVARFADLPLSDVQELLASPVHEHRLAAVLVMVSQFERASRTRTRDERQRALLHDAFLRATARGEVDNWDIVDASAEVLVGRWLRDQPEAVAQAELDRLIAGDLLWERRVAMIATFAWIKAGDAEPTFRLARAVLRDPQPLMHKAAGWMLREVGKRVDRTELMVFLQENAGAMPRTMLAYATEHLEPAERARLRALPRT
jgi:3-methyladenine DNA glycosylase AlkD